LNLDDSNLEFRSGFIAIVGPPNVGKSTLLNRLIGSKIAIVSPKPQTTRNRILGVYQGDGFQMAFMDTPGIHTTRTPLHRSMVSSAQDSLHEVDIVTLMIEMSRPDDKEISLIVRDLKKTKKHIFLVINKIDTGKKDDILPIIAHFSNLYPFDEIIPISALKGDGVDRLLNELRKRLEPGPAFFPEDMKTDQTESFLISEIIREKIYINTSREIPYSSAVSVDRMQDHHEKNLISIYAKIHVESESQKGIIIGHKGKMIKSIGRAARLELEKILGAKVYLELTARVEKNWSRDMRSLRRLGY
jgi:GTP-binding protein Era